MKPTKRSCSPDKSEETEKKAKVSEENTAEESSKTPKPATTPIPEESKGKDEETKETTKTSDKEKEATAKTNAAESSDVITIEDKPTASDNSKEDEKMEEEKKDEEKNNEEEKDEEKKDEEKMEEESEAKEEEKPEPKTQRWQLVPTTTRQRLNYLMTTSKLSDCTFLVGRPDLQQEYKLHSVIMAMSSPEFEDLLCENRMVSIPDVDADVFKQILEYIYLDYVNLWNVEKTQALYRASVKFKLPHLCEKAVEYMMAKMSLDSIWPIYDAAIATQDQILREECNKFFKKNITDLLKHKDFVSADQSVISSLVEDENLGVNEADLITGILKWTHQKCLDMDLVPNMENKRTILEEKTINNLRFLALSKVYFANNVAYNVGRGDESILTMEESYAILMNLVQPNSYPMPEGFSTSIKQRTSVELARLIRRIFNPLGTYQAVTPQTPRLDKLTVLPGPSLTAPFGCKSFSLDLVVSRSIVLHGFQVPTFFPGMIGSAPKVYEETYIASIQNSSKSNKPMLGSINWSGKVAYNASMELLFKEPVRLEKNNTYTIMVYTNNTYYLNQKLCTVEDLNGIKFTLKDSVSLFGKPGKQDFAFVSQIIYSL